jgi:hypothetical protein
MTDQIPEAFTPDAAPSIDLDAIENVLTLDAIISGARLPERTVRIYKRGDLLGQLDDVEGRLEELVDEDGEPFDQDLAIGEESEYSQLVRLSRAIRAELAKDSFAFRVRAMGSSKWKVFVEKWKDTKTGTFKEGMSDALIIESAVSPVIPDQASLDRFREAYAHTQTNAVFQAAFIANTKTGLDIPKLPDSLVALKHEERS